MTSTDLRFAAAACKLGVAIYEGHMATYGEERPHWTSLSADQRHAFVDRAARLLYELRPWVPRPPLPFERVCQ